MAKYHELCFTFAGSRWFLLDRENVSWISFLVEFLKVACQQICYIDIEWFMTYQVELGFSDPDLLY